MKDPEITKALLPETIKLQTEQLEKARLQNPMLRSCLTEFQIRNFLIGREFSRFGQYKAAITEIGARIESLEKLYILRERIQIDIDELQSKLQEVELNVFNQRRLNLDVLEKRSEYSSILTRIEALEVEIGTLSQVLNEFSDEEKLEPEEDYYERKLRREVGLNLALSQPLSTNLIENCLNMPEGCEIRQWIESQIHRQEEESKPNDE